MRVPNSSLAISNPRAERDKADGKEDRGAGAGGTISIPGLRFCQQDWRGGRRHLSAGSLAVTTRLRYNQRSSYRHSKYLEDMGYI